MKKKLHYNFILGFLLTLFAFTNNVFAHHIDGETYLGNVAIDNSLGELTGRFDATNFAEDHPNLDRTRPIELRMITFQEQELLLARFNAADIPTDFTARTTQEFTVRVPQGLDGLRDLSLRYYDGDILQQAAILDRSALVINGTSSSSTTNTTSGANQSDTGANPADTQAGTGVDPSVFGGNAPNGNVDPTEPVNSVVVNWETPILKNTIPGSETGLFYYDIRSRGRLSREKNETVYLNLSKSALRGSSDPTFFTLCSFNPDLGPIFKVNFPECAGDIKLLTSSQVQPGFEYKLFISNQPNGSLVINNSEKGEGIISLQEVPAPAGGPRLKISESRPAILNGKRYYAISGTTGEENIAEPLKAYLVPVAGGARIDLGGINQSPVGTQFELPGDRFESLPSLEPGKYQLVLEAVDQTEILRIDLEDMPREPAGVNQSETLLGNSEIELNETQKTILEEGIVPVNNCGYNIFLTKEEKQAGIQKGRICGFNDAITLIQRSIEYIFILVLPIMALVFAYAGYMYMTSGDSSDKRSKAKKAILHALGGVVLILSAWLIVKTIVVSLGASDATTLFLNIRG